MLESTKASVQVLSLHKKEGEDFRFTVNFFAAGATVIYTSLGSVGRQSQASLLSQVE